MAEPEDSTEEWRPIPFAPAYLVSSHGRVKGRRGRLLSPFINRDGYEMYSLWLNETRLKRGTHVLVCTTFNGERPPGNWHCAHADGDKMNNRPENLRWATAKENAQDGLRLGKYKYGDEHWSRKHPEKLRLGDAHHARLRPDRVPKGQQVYNAKLTDEQAIEIRNAPGGYGYRKALAAKYGVSTYVIEDVRSGRTYKHA